MLTHYARALQRACYFSCHRGIRLTPNVRKGTRTGIPLQKTVSGEIFALKLEKSEDRSEKLYALARLIGFKVFLKARKRFGYQKSGFFLLVDIETNHLQRL